MLDSRYRQGEVAVVLFLVLNAFHLARTALRSRSTGYSDRWSWRWRLPAVVFARGSLTLYVLIYAFARQRDALMGAFGFSCSFLRCFPRHEIDEHIRNSFVTSKRIDVFLELISLFFI